MPLYAVIGVAFLALVLDVAARDRARAPASRAASRCRSCCCVAWEAASLAWSASATEGAKALGFYALPFGALLAALVAHPPPRPRLADLLRVQVALALAFAAVGVYQVLRHDVWWNRKLMVSNAFSSFFRANSIFYDPSIFGRYLAVTITLVFAALLFGRCGGRCSPPRPRPWPGSGSSPRTRSRRSSRSARRSARVSCSPSAGASRCLLAGRRRARRARAHRHALGAPLRRRPRHLGALAARRRRPAAVPRAPPRRRRASAARPTPRASRRSAAGPCAAPST